MKEHLRRNNRSVGLHEARYFLLIQKESGKPSIDNVEPVQYIYIYECFTVRKFRLKLTWSQTPGPIVKSHKSPDAQQSGSGKKEVETSSVPVIAFRGATGPRIPGLGGHQHGAVFPLPTTTCTVYEVSVFRQLQWGFPAYSFFKFQTQTTVSLQPIGRLQLVCWGCLLLITKRWQQKFHIWNNRLWYLW